jgi:hypothetical protein
LGTTGGSGGQLGGQLTTQLNQNNLLGGLSLSFQQGGNSGPILGGSQNQDQTLVVQAGSTYSESFSLSGGSQLDLTQILAGASLSHDLTNISQYVKVLGYGADDPGFASGTKTILQVTGPNGSATVNLEGSGRLSVQNLLQHNSLLLPPH